MTLPVYPWSIAPEWARFAATDASTVAFWYEVQPVAFVDQEMFDIPATKQCQRIGDGFVCTDGWHNSMQARPPATKFTTCNDVSSLFGPRHVDHNSSPAEIKEAIRANAEALMAKDKDGKRDETLARAIWDGAREAGAHDDLPDPAALLLDQARKIITGARRQTYGKPEDNFKTIAHLWSTYLIRAHTLDADGPVLSASDVAAMMVLMKCARLAETPDHADSWRDIAGYAACGARASGADLGGAAQ